MARSAAEMGAVARSASTASTTSSPRTFDATAPWALVQNSHALVRETNAAISSRSPTDHSDGPRMTSWKTSLIRPPKNSVGSEAS